MPVFRKELCDFQVAVCEALRIEPARVKRIEMIMTPGDVAITVTEYLTAGQDLDELRRVFTLVDWREEVPA